MAAGGGPSLSSPALSAGCSCPELSGRARTPSVTRRHTENTVDLEKRAGRLLKSQFHSEFSGETAMFKSGWSVLEQQEQIYNLYTIKPIHMLP